MTAPWLSLLISPTPRAFIFLPLPGRCPASFPSPWPWLHLEEPHPSCPDSSQLTFSYLEFLAFIKMTGFHIYELWINSRSSS